MVSLCLLKKQQIFIALSGLPSPFWILDRDRYHYVYHYIFTGYTGIFVGNQSVNRKSFLRCKLFHYIFFYYILYVLWSYTVLTVW